jgi:hypothetical protein
VAWLTRSDRPHAASVLAAVIDRATGRAAVQQHSGAELHA